MGSGNSTHCKTVNDKGDIVNFFYEREPQSFFENIHKRKGTCQECIQDTCDSIEEGSEIYSVFKDEILAAFFVKFETDGKQALNGFHVLKEYRTREFLTEFWQIVKSKFDKSIYTGIYCKNEPALKCLLKAGFMINNLVLHDNKVFVILKYL